MGQCVVGDEQRIGRQLRQQVRQLTRRAHAVGIEEYAIERARHGRADLRRLAFDHLRPVLQRRRAQVGPRLPGLLRRTLDGDERLPVRFAQRMREPDRAVAVGRADFEHAPAPRAGDEQVQQLGRRQFEVEHLAAAVGHPRVVFLAEGRQPGKDGRRGTVEFDHAGLRCFIFRVSCFMIRQFPDRGAIPARAAIRACLKPRQRDRRPFGLRTPGRMANDAHGPCRRAKMRRQRFQRRHARRAAHRPPLFPQESFPCPSRCTRPRCPS